MDSNRTWHQTNRTEARIFFSFKNVYIVYLGGKNLNYKVVAIEKSQLSYVFFFNKSSAVMFGHVHSVNQNFISHNHIW